MGELSDVVTGQVQRLLAVCNGANVDQPQTVMNPTYSERQGQFLTYIHWTVGTINFIEPDEGFLELRENQSLDQATDLSPNSKMTELPAEAQLDREVFARYGALMRQRADHHTII